MFKSRKGVSLFTVLMFMLVATIAGTATYKWLSSEGFSSASRMMMSEARASAAAGVDAARAWMTYHANETGAVLRQYIVNNRQPVSLDAMLKPMAKNDQSFAVSVVGVEAPVTSASYKVKIVSTGYSRNGNASYNETAVLNVMGLYRVIKPVEEVVHHIDYHYSYFGGSTSFAGAHDNTAMLINGNWGDPQNGGNPGRMTGDFIVTGTVKLSGNDITVGGTTCVGKDIFADNGLVTGNLYVGGASIPKSYSSDSATFCANITKDAYFDGNVLIGEKAIGFSVGRNVFVNKRLVTNMEKFAHTINGNLCLSDDGAVVFNNESKNYKFTVNHNVWMPKSYKDGARGIVTGNLYTAYSHRIFGNTVGDEAYIKDASSCHSAVLDNKTVDCSGDPAKFFQRHMNGNTQHSYAGFTTKNTLPTSFPTDPPFDCGKDVKTYCNSIWRTATQEEKNKCDGAPYFVPDILRTGHEEFEKFVPAHKGLGTNASQSGVNACNNLTHFSDTKVDNMNTCYDAMYTNKNFRKQYLFNDYLVVRLESNENASSGADDANHRLNGKFLFIYEDALAGNTPHFPQTEPNAKVFVYLKNGTESNTHISCSAGKDKDKGDLPYNYFIFSKKDIGGLLGNCVWSGSFYGSATYCGKIGDINGNVELQYNQDVIDDMVRSGIICEASSTTCGTPPGSSSSAAAGSSASTAFDGAYDPYFIATGPQLHIQVESETKISKPASSASAVEPSVLALPRVVYLNENSPGKLSDYVSTLALNGAKYESEEIVCPGTGAPSGTDVIYNNGVGPRQGVYNCTLTARGTTAAYTSPFYVYVAGASESTPMVHFNGDVNVDFVLGQSNEATVSLMVDGGGSSGTFEVHIARSDLPNGWSVVHYEDGSAVEWETASDGTKFYVVTKPYSSQTSQYPIFKVKTNSSAASGMVYFTLQNPQGCIIGGGPVLKSYNIKGAATFERLSLAKYCETYPTKCPTGGTYAIAATLQDCPSMAGTWVRADGIGCDATIANDRWICDAAVGAANEVKLVSVTYDDVNCILYNPTENNSVVNPQDDISNPGGYKLYASLKRKHHTLFIDVKNTVNNNSGIEVWTSEQEAGSYSKLGTCKSSSGCEYIVYSGMHVKLIPHEEGRDHFSYWESTGSYLDAGQKPIPTLQYAVDGSRSYTAQFNKKDEHCFYTDFSQTEVWCNSDNLDNCVDQCKTSLPCDIDGGVYKDAGWLIVNTNKGQTHAPQVQGQSYIGRNGNGHVLLMLNTVKAGSDGTFSSLMFAETIKEKQSNKTKETLNYGIVVRSNKNGSEYISVNLYGVGKNQNSADKTYARVCYLDHVEMSESEVTQRCEEKLVKKSNGSNLGWTDNTPLNVIVTLEGDSLFTTVSYTSNGTVNEAEARFGLVNVVKNGSSTLNDDVHEYVGLKLGGTKYGAFNASWSSAEYSAECFDKISVYCSFAAKYVGAAVPKNESVTPIIAYSRWFTDQNGGSGCVSNVKYFYNGCDMPLSKYGEAGATAALASCLLWYNEGPVEKYLAHKPLRLKNGEEFQFGYEGMHGIPHATRPGYVRNASIEVDCRAVNGGKYTSSCGEFYVGDIHSCTQDILISDGSPNHGVETFTIESPITDGMNLRDAAVVFDLEKSPGVTVNVHFVDVSGVSSDVVSLTQPGVNEVSYEKFSNKFGFNPEKVVSVVLVGTGNYSVKSIESQCSYSLKVRCGIGDAFYSGSSWHVRASVDPLPIAKKCKVESVEDIADTYFGNCTGAGIYLRDDPGFLDRLNQGSENLQYSFKVSVYDDENATITSEPKAECVATTQEYEPIEISCSLDGENATVVEGAGVPAFILSAQNCPADGCVYEMSLSTGDEYAHTSNLTTQQVWQPGLNTATKLATGHYTYTGKIYNANKTTVLKSCNNVGFDVVAAQPASASSCKVEDGAFSAFIDGSGTDLVNTALIITDAQGVPVQTLNSAVNVKNYVNYNVPTLTSGNYILSLHVNGDQGCSLLYSTEGAGSPIAVTCPDDVTDQNPSSAISVSPTVTGCENDCSWEVVGGTSGNTGTGYSTGNISFYDNNGSGTKEYTFKVKRTVNDYQLSAQCKFDVTFAAPAPEITVSCPTVTGQNPSQNISQSPSVSGCNGECSWTIKKGSTSLNSGNSCSSISFKDANGSGTVNYTFTATCTENGQSDSESCTIGVTYASNSEIASGTRLSGGNYTISGWTNEWCSGNTRITVQQTQPVNAYGNCLEWVEGKNRSYDGNNQYNCQGKITVTYPFKVSIPSGKEVELRCN